MGSALSRLVPRCLRGVRCKEGGKADGGKTDAVYEREDFSESDESIRDEDEDAPKPKTDLREVRVGLSWIGAREVSVAGDFSEWKPMKLKEEKPGCFSVSFLSGKGRCVSEESVELKTELVLAGGSRHEMKFVVDGSWVTSPELPLVPNGLGSHNNLLQV